MRQTPDIPIERFEELLSEWSDFDAWPFADFADTQLQSCSQQSGRLAHVSLTGGTMPLTATVHDVRADEICLLYPAMDSWRKQFVPGRVNALQVGIEGTSKLWQRLSGVMISTMVSLEVARHGVFMSSTARIDSIRAVEQPLAMPDDEFFEDGATFALTGHVTGIVTDVEPLERHSIYTLRLAQHAGTAALRSNYWTQHVGPDGLAYRPAQPGDIIRADVRRREITPRDLAPQDRSPVRILEPAV